MNLKKLIALLLVLMWVALIGISSALESPAAPGYKIEEPSVNMLETQTEFVIVNNAVPSSSGTHRGTDFWIAFPDTYYRNRGAEIIIMSDVATNYTVSGIISASGSVAPGFPAIVPVPSSATITSDGVVENKGIHVTADSDIAVVFRTPMGNGGTSDDAYLALPTNGLGKEYYIVSYDSYYGTYSMPSQFVSIATENNTNVTFSGDGYTLPTTVTMNHGQTYQKKHATDVTGAHIVSDKPTVAIGSTYCSDVPLGVHFCDTLLGTQLSVPNWGTDYYVTPLNSLANGRIRVIASENNTNVTINSSSITTVSLNSGQWIEYDINKAHITSDKPISVFEFAEGFDIIGFGDPFEMLIVPTDRFLNHYRLYTPHGYMQGDYVTIISPDSAQSSVLLDGSALTATWHSLQGGTYSYAIAPVGTGEHTIDASDGVGVYAHGYTYYGSYGYPAGLSLKMAGMVGNVTGGGWIISPITPAPNNNGKAPVNNKATFGFVAHYVDGASMPSGNLQYTDHVNGMNVHGNVTTLSVDKTTMTATLRGIARVDGVDGYAYTVTVMDNGEPGKTDTFAIEIPALTYSASGTLGGGNIRVDP